MPEHKKLKRKALINNKIALKQEESIDILMQKINKIPLIKNNLWSIDTR